MKNRLIISIVIQTTLIVLAAFLISIQPEEQEMGNGIMNLFASGLFLYNAILLYFSIFIWIRLKKENCNEQHVRWLFFLSVQPAVFIFSVILVYKIIKV